ncbi:MAG: Lrp/AsnC family transcriptional regulator [Bdellovibrionaceae bacterium]|nr:Lrp/AsnC family transcriptional regulator [Pseudobdellovibrionaceae bacterium]
MALITKLGTAGMDELDLKIIKQLSTDSKMSFQDLGQQVGLTAPAVHARVKKMEKSGVIQNYGVNLDYARIGLDVTAFVRLQTGKMSCSTAGTALSKYPEIEECHSVAGEDDVIIKTRTATPLELQNLLDRLRTEGLAEKSVSIFVLETHFERSRL